MDVPGAAAVPAAAGSLLRFSPRDLRGALWHDVVQAGKVGPWLPVRWCGDGVAKHHRVVERDVVVPDERRAGEVGIDVGLLEVDVRLRVFPRPRPVAVVEVDGEPVVRQ